MNQPTSKTWALVPIKPPKSGKNRLKNVLDDEDREIIIEKFFQHVIGTLYQCSGIKKIVVITLDETFGNYAQEEYGATVLTKDPLDLNKTVTFAYQAVKDMGAESVLILPADLPLLQVEDIETILAIDGKFVICPDRHMVGTNGLLLRGVDRFQFRYGAESFTEHLSIAKNQGITPQVAFATGIEFDIDTPKDWIDYQEVLAANEARKKRS